MIENFRRISYERIAYEGYMIHARAGSAPNPALIHTEECNIMPPLDSRLGQSFEQVTDLRAQEIGEIVSTDDRPILVYWSGGIDSTLILSAMVRNWTRELLDRIVVIMNNASYLENPMFFEKIIKKYNLRFSEHTELDWTQAWITNGQPADPLWIQADLLEIDRWHPGCHKFSLRNNPDVLLSWLSFKTDNIHAHWLYEMMMQNIKSLDGSLLDYEDFYWWLNFNFLFSGQVYKLYHHKKDSVYTKNLFPLFSRNTIPWYRSQEYQIWSIENRSNGVKYSGSIRSYKMPAKEYIYSVDKNPWYKDYKTKLASGKIHVPNNILAIWDDGTVELA